MILIEINKNTEFKTIKTMTLEQITTINNAMSSLTVLDEIANKALEAGQCYQYIYDHVKAMKEAGVPQDICKHYQTIGEMFFDNMFL